ncbi:MAG TPA: phosphatidylglycerol lysyltransferase domain-containing protein, partial [Thermomicrobiales bacterium]|nr:phosphatidylglycerol lysyltransferase domain-containing protein [Thermomicrobiales bacterium]
AAVSLIRPYVWKHAVYPAEQRHARSLIDSHGSASDDFFKYADDKSFFFSGDGSGVVSYGVSTGTALVLGDPVARDAPSMRATLDEFLDFVDAHGWHPAFHHATPTHLQLYRDAGLIPLKIGAEAIVDLDAFTLAGKHGKNFRSTIARFTRDGYRAVFTEPPIPAAKVAQLREVSNEWLTLDGRRERGFTLGRFSDEYVARSPIVSLESADGRIEAFMNVIPDGVPGEITFDLMRHRVNAPNSSVDFVVLAAFRYAQERGFHRASLGMVPFAEVGTDPNAALRERALARLTERFNHYFAATSLYAYKDKFHPTWEPRYLVYSGDAWLPSIGLAISRLTEKPLTAVSSSSGADHD